VTDPPTSPVPPAGLPENWGLDRDLPCPTCAYNLRMLRTPRCPECGLIFRWQTLLRISCPRCGEALFTTDTDECPHCKLHLEWARLLKEAPDQARHLFEYTNRPGRAAIRTWAAALWPWRFWRQIRLENPPVIRRLRWLRRVAVGVCLLGLILLAGLAWSPVMASIQAAAALAASVLVLPLATTVGLPMFTPTLGRFRIRRDQLLRCLAYACSGLFWIGLTWTLGALLALAVNTYYTLTHFGLWIDRFGRGPVQFNPDLLIRMAMGSRSRYALRGPGQAAFTAAIALVVIGLGYVWWWAFFYVSLRRYLRLDRRNAVALFLSTQIIGLLLLAIVLFALTGLAVEFGLLSLRFIK
jgi:hypothetical protein